MKKSMRAVFTNNNISGKILVGNKKTVDVGARDILVSMHAASVNPIDWRFIKYVAPFYPFSIILGHDGAGEVVKVGAKVSHLKPGDRVFGLKVYSFRGSFAEYFRLNDKHAYKVPENLSLTEAAAYPLVGLTAIQAFKWADLKPGQNVLVVGGSGGVGHAAVQVAKALGANVTAVCSTRNIDFVRSLGADEVLDYTAQNILETPRKFDVVFDTVGNLSHQQCSPILQPGGLYVTTLPNRQSLLEIVLTYAVGWISRKWRRSWFVVLNANQEDFKTLSGLISSNKLKIKIDTKFPLSEANTAIQASKQSRTVGKNILLIKDD